MQEKVKPNTQIITYNLYTLSILHQIMLFICRTGKSKCSSRNASWSKYSVQIYINELLVKQLYFTPKIRIKFVINCQIFCCCKTLGIRLNLNHK